MRDREYLSPSALSTWKKDQEEYFMRYLADAKAPKPGQTQPMGVGSSFDAYVKDYLYAKLNGTSKGTEFDFEKLFPAQVEEHNRDFALEAGKICLDAYRVSGALPDLVATLEDGSDHVFEISLQEEITLEEKSVVLMGKPDLMFKSPCGRPVILDWKVNGYCSKSMTSPSKGYIMCRDGWNDGTHSRTHGKFHKDAWLSEICPGLWYNSAYSFEEFAPQWAAQLATYIWLCGEPIGSDTLVIIHQLAWGNGKCRVADIRGVISEDYQRNLFKDYADLWNAVKTGLEGYMDLARIEQLNHMAQQSFDALNSGDANERAFVEMTRRA